MAEYNIQKIREILGKNIAQVSEQILSSDLKILQKNISQYLLSFSLFRLQLKTLRANTENAYAGAQSQQISVNYSVFKQMMEYSNQINQLMKDGYQIVHRLREWLTGEVITYQIGTQFKGKLYEHSYSLDQILSHAQVQYAGKNILSLRLHMTKTTVKNDALSLENKLQNITKQGTTVFSQIFRYFYTSQSGKKPVNKGNAYEVYRSVIAQRKWSNPNKIEPLIDISPQSSLSAFLDNRLRSIRSNVIAGYKGGDVLTEQDKFISHDPSLISIVSIQKVLTAFNNAIQNYSNGKELYRNMLGLFTKDDYRNSISEKMELEALDKATKKLKENIDRLSIILNI